MLFDYSQSTGKSQKFHMNYALGKHFQIVIGTYYFYFSNASKLCLVCVQQQRDLIRQLTVYVRMSSPPPRSVEISLILKTQIPMSQALKPSIILLTIQLDMLVNPQTTFSVFLLRLLTYSSWNVTQRQRLHLRDLGRIASSTILAELKDGFQSTSLPAPRFSRLLFSDHAYGPSSLFCWSLKQQGPLSCSMSISGRASRLSPFPGVGLCGMVHAQISLQVTFGFWKLLFLYHFSHNLSSISWESYHC